MSEEAKKRVTAGQGILLLILVVGLIVFGAKVGANGTMIMGLTWVIIYAFCVIWKFDFSKVQNAGFDAVRRCMGAICILITVGMLVGAWIASGTIPTLIYYGLSIISPKVFLLCCLIITSIMSVCTGTSYGSAASAGVAMMGIGLSMGLPAGMVAGAILCGATFGDKISPLSDTTNICPALCGGNLFKHIKSQMYTTLPAYIVCIIVFTFLGFRVTGNITMDTSSIQSTMQACADNFVISPVCLLPLVLVILLLLFKVDVVPAIMIGSLGGLVISILVQGHTFVSTIGNMWSGYVIESGNAIVDKLMNRGGVTSMASAFVCIIFAVGMGAMLEEMGVMDVFVKAITTKLTSVFRLIGATMLVSYFAGALTGAMTSANVITGKLMSPLFKEKGLAPEVCSRTMVDTGTIGGVLIPWHSNSFYYAGVLGVAWAEFVPFCILSYTVPIFSLILAATGIGIFYVDKEGNRISKEEWKKLYPDAVK
ncbi:MAG: Na+/H+ antiporter NhaC [Coprococcus sp.]